MLDSNDIKVIGDLLEKQSASLHEEIRSLQGETRSLHEEVNSLQKDMKSLHGEMQDQYNGIMAFIESHIDPQLQMLAEGHASILEKMTPAREIVDMKTDISILKDAMKYLSAKLQALENKVS